MDAVLDSGVPISSIDGSSTGRDGVEVSVTVVGQQSDADRLTDHLDAAVPDHDSFVEVGWPNQPTVTPSPTP